MGAYISGNLQPGEAVVSEAEIHWVVFIFPSLIVLFGLVSIVASVPILGIVLLIVGILSLGIKALDRSTTEIAVTNKRIIGKTGIISRNLFDMNLAKVEGAQFNQGIIGRILGYGSITISGTGAGQQLYNHIANPISFQKEINLAVQNSSSNK